MRVLITGAAGQLGRELAGMLASGQAEIGPIPACYADAVVHCADADTLDITDAVAVDAFLSQGFDVVFNCAAYTNVDGCEAHEDDAFAVNATGPANLARACQKHGGKLVHVSTDYVFPGNQPEPRVETDDVAPISAYGRTKLAGERAVAEACPRHFIVRTAWLYGHEGKNFVKTMMRLGASLESVTVVDDQLGCPTNANDVAYQMLRIAETENYGIYHCVNAGTCSWADFAQAIMQEAGLDCEVLRCTSQEYKEAHPESASRPAYSSLVNGHLRDTIGDTMRPWQEALHSYMGK